jgi:tetratricopeptide (TPR) repeat protein
MGDEAEDYSNAELKELIGKFEQMISSGSFVFFDANDYEEIIEYYFQSYDPETLLIALTKAISQYPNNASFKISNAQLLAAQEKTSEALKILNDLELSDATDEQLYMTRGYIYSQMGLSEQAIENYKTALKYTTEPHEVYLSLGMEFMNKKEVDNSLFYLKKALSLDPKNDVIVSEIALCYEMSDKKDEAADFFSKYVDEHPYSEFGWFNLGVSFSRILMYEKAIDAYDFVLTINPKFSSAYFNKANSLAQLGKYYEAIDVYKETFTHESPDPAAMYYIGECYENLEDLPNALVYYNRCVKHEPTFADAWISIGIVLELQNRLTEALHYVKKALEIQPENPDFWYVFAEVQEKLGFFEEALGAYQKVIECNYDDSDVWLDYSNCLLASGYKEDAKTLEVC